MQDASKTKIYFILRPSMEKVSRLVPTYLCKLLVHGMVTKQLAVYEILAILDGSCHRFRIMVLAD